MAELEIPEHARTGINILDKLSAQLVAKIKDSLESSGPILLRSNLARHIAREVDLSLSDANEMVDVLVALYITRERFDDELDEFVDKVATSVRETFPDFEKYERLEENLKVLLALETSIGLSSKAAAVISDHSHVYRSARILSDIRPVFGRDAEAAPIAATTVHTLKITYAAAEKSNREFFVALDIVDLLELQDLISRALKKEDVLAKIVSSSQMKFIDIREQ